MTGMKTGFDYLKRRCIDISKLISGVGAGLTIREKMVHPGGFEPPTARFVAEYSIQLSYGCIGNTILLLASMSPCSIVTLKKMVHPEG